MKSAENAQFEHLIEKLRTVIEIVESDEATLENSLKAYEEGAQLVKQAQQYLTEAEQRINVLSESLSDGAAESTE